MDLQPVSPSNAHANNPDLAAMAPLCSVFRRYLKSRGQKYTPERADVLDVIIQHDEPFEADDLIDELKQRGYSASKATVYRTIRLLLDAGIIIHTPFEAERSKYQLIYGREPHDELICIQTGERIGFNDARLIRLRDELCAEKGWEPVGHRLVIYAVKRANAASRD